MRSCLAAIETEERKREFEKKEKDLQEKKERLKQKAREIKNAAIEAKQDCRVNEANNQRLIGSSPLACVLRVILQ